MKQDLKVFCFVADAVSGVFDAEKTDHLICYDVYAGKRKGTGGPGTTTHRRDG